MESFPQVPPATSDRAVSAGPQRNPMEDSDSSLTRKRPRLDSGSRSYRSMSADRLMSSPSAKLCVTARTTPPLDTYHIEPASREHMDLTHDSTPSKMTINIRDAASEPCLAPTAPIDDIITYQTNDRDELANSSDPDLPKRPPSSSPNHVSPPSSSSRSPEIEVAEVEDISQEPGHTKWRTLASAHDPIKTPDDLWAIFPYRDRTQNLWEAAEELCRQFHHRRFTGSFIGSLLTCSRSERGSCLIEGTCKLDSSISSGHRGSFSTTTGGIQ